MGGLIDYEDIKLIDSASKIKANKYIIYFIIFVVFSFIIYFVIVYKKPDPFEKGKTIRWVITGNEDITESGAKYSYDGIKYFPTEGEYLLSPRATGYGKAYDNENFFWMVGGGVEEDLAPGTNKFSSLLNSYNGYTWIINQNPLQYVYDIEYGLSGNSEPCWLAIGLDITDGSVPRRFTNRIISSKDGQNWEKTKGISFTVGYGIGYGKTTAGKHMYQAGIWNNPPYDEYEYGIIAYSYEGLCWMKSTGSKFIGFEAKPVSINYGLNGTDPIWVATGSQTSSKRSIVYSDDGIHWQDSTGEDFTIVTGHNKAGQYVAFGLDNLGNSLWVAVGGYDSSSILYSHNGISWNKATGSSFELGKSVEYGKDDHGDPMWIAVGLPSGVSTDEILISYNGTSWIAPSTTDSSMSMGYGIASNVLKYGVKTFI